VNTRIRGVMAVVLVVIIAVAGYVILASGSSKSHGPTPTATTCSPGGNWTTYHQNLDRAGVQTGLPGTTASPRWQTPTSLDGQVYAEPLVCGNSVFVSTENNSVYSINGTTGLVQWRTNLGTPVPGNTLPCGDIDPSGITGTPVIDAATGTIYVVAFLFSSGGDQHVLFGLDIDTGVVVSTEIADGSGASPEVEQERGALALGNGYVYVPYGGLAGDCGPYHGWVVGVPIGASGPVLSYQVPTSREGGIWSPGGITISPGGDLFVATGNGAATMGFDYGDSVIELSPTLTVLGYFAPTNWAQLNADDTDLGSVAPTVLPNGDVFQIGKAGVGYILSGTNLGGIGGQIYNASICDGGYGGTAHVGQSVLVPCTNGLFDVIVSGTSFSVAWQTVSFDSGSPIVTGDVVWAVNTSTGDLLGFSLTTGAELFDVALDSADHFISPTAAPGSVFVADGSELFAINVG
jgi:hypothetical protein